MTSLVFPSSSINFPWSVFSALSLLQVISKSALELVAFSSFLNRKQTVCLVSYYSNHTKRICLITTPLHQFYCLMPKYKVNQHIVTHVDTFSIVFILLDNLLVNIIIINHSRFCRECESYSTTVSHIQRMWVIFKECKSYSTGRQQDKLWWFQMENVLKAKIILLYDKDIEKHSNRPLKIVTKSL